jgi:hypothetical protein
LDSPRTNTLPAVALLAGLLLAPRSSAALDAGVWAELAQVRDLQADFSQVQHRAILQVPLESHGHLRFVRPATLTWEVLGPSRSTFTLQDKVARMAYPDLQMSETFDLGAVPDADRLATSLLVWMQADAAAVARDFDTSYSDRPPTATLVPRDATLRALVGAIRVVFAEGPWRVRAVTLVEPGGDTVELSFRSVVLDGAAVPDPVNP